MKFQGVFPRIVAFFTSISHVDICSKIRKSIKRKKNVSPMRFRIESATERTRIALWNSEQFNWFENKFDMMIHRFFSFTQLTPIYTNISLMSQLADGTVLQDVWKEISPHSTLLLMSPLERSSTNSSFSIFTLVQPFSKTFLWLIMRAEEYGKEVKYVKRPPLRCKTMNSIKVTSLTKHSSVHSFFESTIFSSSSSIHTELFCGSTIF